VHGLIFFYMQKFADRLSLGGGGAADFRATVVREPGRYQPSAVYPDAEAVQILEGLSAGLSRPLPAIIAEFGEFLAPNLVRVAGPWIDPTWRTLDLIQNTETLIHSMVRTAKPGADPPVLETVRVSAEELQLVYSSRRRLCVLATGLMRGMARHFGEKIDVCETSCMLKGDPFCSFTIRRLGGDTHASHSPLSETVELSPGFSPSADVLLDLASDPLPDRIGDYEILGLVGSGTMGRVYAARDARLDRRVAIKVMAPARSRDPAARRRFVRESKAAAAIEHPHVVAIHQVGEDSGVPFIVMQLLEGFTLASHSHASGRLPLPEVLRIGQEISAGLAAAHGRGLVHRDMKPDNVFLEGKSRSVRIIDFGLARDLGENDTKLTLDGALVGTPAYMSPERIASQELDARSDLFSLGVILYELLAGRLPFEGASVVAMLAAVGRGAPTPLAEAAPDLPPAVCELVMQLIAHDKALRPVDADVVAAELADLQRRFRAC
jgi:tRNA A-37 threonylcarbamoyl transferase component Bud32